MTTQEILWDGMDCVSGQGQMTGCFEPCNEISGYVKCGEILGQLTGYGMGFSRWTVLHGYSCVMCKFAVEVKPRRMLQLSLRVSMQCSVHRNVTGKQQVDRYWLHLSRSYPHGPFPTDAPIRHTATVSLAVRRQLFCFLIPHIDPEEDNTTVLLNTGIFSIRSGWVSKVVVPCVLPCCQHHDPWFRYSAV